METFGDLLKQCINSQGLTVYGLAKETGINRSFLQGVLSGAKKLPQKRFNDVINQRFFTAQQIAMLCEKFFADKIGKKDMQRINYVEKDCAANTETSFLGKRNIRFAKSRQTPFARAGIMCFP